MFSNKKLLFTATGAGLSALLAFGNHVQARQPPDSIARRCLEARATVEQTGDSASLAYCGPTSTEAATRYERKQKQAETKSYVFGVVAVLTAGVAAASRRKKPLSPSYSSAYTPENRRDENLVYTHSLKPIEYDWDYTDPMKWRDVVRAEQQRLKNLH